MTTRALARAGLAPVPHIDLPVGPRPQYVNDRGIEIDDDDIRHVFDLIDGANPHTALGEDADVGNKEEEVDATIEVDAEPLLSLAESLVLPFSLAQTRQRHLTHLLPHAFSHPPIPSNAKPRARGPPKGTFLFPTPALPPAPLPLKEYHGSSRQTEPAVGSPAPATPAVEGQDPTEASTSGTVNPAAATADTPTATKTKSKKQERYSAPAHEIDCIARVTLTIGPVSYPGTELWIGRFVEPKGEAKTIRQREKGDKLPRAEKKERKKPAIPGMSQAGPGVRPMAGFRPPARPMVPLGPPPRMPGGPLPRPPGGPPTRPPIEPSLIQRVNFAATQHPWLSIIIHKAARNSASKEELAKLGRIVARLGKGEGVGEGPLEGLPTAVPAAVPTAAASSSSIAPPSSAPTSLSSTTNTATGVTPVVAPPAAKAGADDDSSDDEKAVMTGRPQTGGGPIDPELRPEVAKKPVATSSSLLPGPLSAKSPINFAASGVKMHNPPGTAQSVPPAPPTTGRPYNPLLPPADSSSFDRPPTPAYVIPPRRIYPLPPPFLLIAFKETPTEKYLLPLGSNSFVSRVGSSSTSTKVDERMAPGPVLAAPPQKVSEVAPPIEPTAIPVKKGRGTRKSLGRGAKETAIVDAPAAKEEPLVDPIIEDEPAVEPLPTTRDPDLPTLPGMKALDGTVLLSTIVPTNGWIKPEWNGLEQRLPFYSMQYDTKPTQTPTANMNTLGDPSKTANSPKAKKKEPISPLKNRYGRLPDEHAIQLKSDSLLNLGAERLIPAQGDVQAVTIRLEGVDEATWLKMRWVIEHVDGAEMKAFGDVQPDLLDDVPAEPHTSTPRIPAPFNASLHPRLRSAYSDWKRSHFEHLLRRVPPRKFPRYRLSAPRSDLKDATTDRWAPRPYPMSTRPLYLTSPPPDDMVYVTEETNQPKRKRGQAEEEVMFEMPVSLDMLDERVEAGAKKSVNRRVGKLKLDKVRRLNADGTLGKRFGKRYKVGTICEGCAREGLKVWRRGPGGKGTLCNECGDKFGAGTLGELKAPGAAAADQEDDADEPGADVGGNNGEGANAVKVENDEAETTTVVPLALEPAGEAAEAEVEAPLGVEEGSEGAVPSTVTLAEVSITSPVKLVEEIEDSLMPPAGDLAAPSTSGT